jgi:hypothetical protein
LLLLQLYGRGDAQDEPGSPAVSANAATPSGVGSQRAGKHTIRSSPLSASAASV